MDLPPAPSTPDAPSPSLLSHYLLTWQEFWALRSNGWHLSIFRLLWVPFHVEFAISLLRSALLERDLPPLPYPGLALFSHTPLSLLLLIATIHLLCALLLLLGWRTRIAQVLLCLTSFLLFFRSASSYQNHYALYLFVTAYLTLAPTERYFSLDAWRLKRQLSREAFHAWQEEPVPLLAHKLILLQAGFLYFFAGLNKLSPSWLIRWSTTTEMLDLMGESPAHTLWTFLLAHNLAWIPLVLAASLMLSLSLGIFLGRGYPVIVLLATLLHLMLDVHLPIMQFTPMMLAILFLALYPPTPPLRTVLSPLSSLTGRPLYPSSGREDPRGTPRGSPRALQGKKNRP